jgi:hypothetical protein
VLIERADGDQIYRFCGTFAQEMWLALSRRPNLDLEDGYETGNQCWRAMGVSKGSEADMNRPPFMSAWCQERTRAPVKEVAFQSIRRARRRGELTLAGRVAMYKTMMSMNLSKLRLSIPAR